MALEPGTKLGHYEVVSSLTCYPTMRPNMSRIAIVALTTLLLAGGASSADVVYLLNGGAFEDVEAEVTETQVRIHLPIGSINLSRSEVLRVEESSSLLGEFRSREDLLRRRDNSTAADWVELARWAVRHSYEPGLKKATRVAARLDPRAEGLPPLMRELGFEYDGDLDRWTREPSPQRHRSTAARQAWRCLCPGISMFGPRHQLGTARDLMACWHGRKHSLCQAGTSAPA